MTRARANPTFVPENAVATRNPDICAGTPLIERVATEG